MIEYGDIVIFDDKHKLLCGDSTKNEDIKKIIVNEFIFYTDPPYNASFNGRSGDHNIILNDSMDDIDFYNFTKKWYDNIKIYFNINPLYIWCNNYLKHIIESIDKKRWVIKNKTPIIWNKNNFGMGINYRGKYEMLMFDGNIDEDIKNECNVWDINKDNGENYIHPTQKPIECFERGIQNHKKIINVIDIFAGSGSSLIATHKLNKNWYGIELDEQYCDKIIRRYYDYTFTHNIKLIRNGITYDFDYIKKELQLLKGASKKGEILEQTRLF